MECEECGSGVSELEVELGASKVDAELENIISDGNESRGDKVVLTGHWWKSSD